MKYFRITMQICIWAYLAYILQNAMEAREGLEEVFMKMPFLFVAFATTKILEYFEKGDKK